MDYLIQYKRLRARARYLIKESKRTTWRTYISSITSYAPTSVIWRKIRSIRGNRTALTVRGLLVNGNITTSPEEIAEELATHFADISSSAHYNVDFLRYKNQTEQNPIDFSSRRHEDYNDPFTLPELQEALNRCKPTAPGPDLVHNKMLQNLSLPAQRFLLLLFNRIWIENVFPSGWREAIIPIPKEGKDQSKHSNYRPISLTSCICKLLERMVNSRLVWVLENKGLLNPIQCGFRKNRSTLDLLLNLSTEICNSFLRRQHLVAVFLDIQKAYDQTWRYGILQTLYNWGFRGNLPNFIRNIMTYRVRVGTTLSNLHYQENGVPQGSTLSVILFIIAINSITEIVRPPIHSSLFVDDFAIYCTSTNIEIIEHQLQLALNRLSKFSNTTGFTFSANKTCCVHFCRKYKSHRDPSYF